jgi:hypothetical protein
MTRWIGRAKVWKEAGFEGFVRLAEISEAGVPRPAGVYVILGPSQDQPQFVPRSVAGFFKGKDPSVLIADLERAWVHGACSLYREGFSRTA